MPSRPYQTNKKNPLFQKPSRQAKLQLQTLQELNFVASSFLLSKSRHWFQQWLSISTKLRVLVLSFTNNRSLGLSQGSFNYYIWTQFMSYTQKYLSRQLMTTLLMGSECYKRMEKGQEVWHCQTWQQIEKTKHKMSQSGCRDWNQILVSTRTTFAFICKHQQLLKSGDQEKEYFWH